MTTQQFKYPSAAEARLSLPDYNDAQYVRGVVGPRTAENVGWIGVAKEIPGQPGTGGGVQIWMPNPGILIGEPWVPVIPRLPAYQIPALEE